MTTTLAPPPAAPPPITYLVPGLYEETLTTMQGATYTAWSAVRVDFPAPAPALIALVLTPESPALGKGDTLFLDAIGLFADGSTRVVTTLATWTAADPTIASVSGAGTVTALAPGATVIRPRWACPPAVWRERSPSPRPSR